MTTPLTQTATATAAAAAAATATATALSPLSNGSSNGSISSSFSSSSNSNIRAGKQHPHPWNKKKQQQQQQQQQQRYATTSYYCKSIRTLYTVILLAVAIFLYIQTQYLYMPNWWNQNMKSEWWKEHVESLVTVYQYQQPHQINSSTSSWWCIPATPTSVSLQRGHSKANTKQSGRQIPKTGLYLTKIYKAASTTAASVSIQIAEAMARQTKVSGCPFHVRHGQAHRKRQAPNFLWTVVRNPHERIVSRYFFNKISRGGQEYNSSELIASLQQESNFMLEYIGDYDFDEEKPLDSDRAHSRPKNKHKHNKQRPTQSHTQILDRMADVFDEYDFIAVTERMDESLAVMKLLFDLPYESLVVFDSKTSGGLDDGIYKHTCHLIQKSGITPDVEAFITDGDYQHTNADYFLYELANQSLDRTMDVLGRSRVKTVVKNLQKLRDLAVESCLESTVFPCDHEGQSPNKHTSCYYGDWGCGHECTMAIVRNATTNTKRFPPTR